MCLTLCDPAGLLCPWDFPGKNTGVGCHVLLQGIFLTQVSNPHLLGLLRGQASSLPPCHPGNPKNIDAFINLYKCCALKNRNTYLYYYVSWHVHFCRPIHTCVCIYMCIFVGMILFQYRHQAKYSILTDFIITILVSFSCGYQTNVSLSTAMFLFHIHWYNWH